MIKKVIIKKNFRWSGVCYFPPENLTPEEIKSGGEFLVKPPEFPPETELRLTSLVSSHHAPLLAPRALTN